MGSVSGTRPARVRSRRPFILAVLAILAVLDAAGCRRPGPSATRLIVDSPERVLRIDAAGAPAGPPSAIDEGPLRIDLDHEVREAFWVQPGRPVERTIDVPSAAALRFAVGAPVMASPAPGLRVSAERVSGRRDPGPIVRRVPIGSSPLPSTNGRNVAWREETLDLGALAGERVRLRFELGVEPPSSAVVGGPAGVAVANPVLVSSARAPERPNLVLVSIDTLRADRLQHTGGSRGTSPLTEAWTREHAVAFKQAVAQAPWTLPSHASLLTGLDPLRHGANHPFRPLAPEITTLAETLRTAGYFTAGITGGGWLDPAYGLSQGFERYRYWPDEGHGDLEWEDHARRVVEWISALPRPFFLLVHTYDVHDYARAPRIAPGTPDDERARLYDRAVGHMDARLGRLLARLASPDLARRTAVVVTSDHGEGLGEEGDYGHGSFREHVLRVPLLIALPEDRAFLRRVLGRTAARSVDAQVRSMDVAPTLTELAGLSPPAGLDGVSLLSFLRHGGQEASLVAPSYFARAGYGLSLREGARLKYRFDDAVFAAPGSREALFDLESDPREARNLAPDDPRLAGLRRTALQRLEQLSGLTVRLSAGRSGATATLRGDLVRDGVPSVIDWPPPGLQGLGPDGVEVRLPPGRDTRLVFQPVGLPRVEILTVGSRASIEVPERAARGALRFDGRTWAREAAGEGPCSGVLCVQLAWQGVRDPRSWTIPMADDAERRARLEALGYVR
jgi:arylsulfatase A-like enzyme